MQTTSSHAETSTSPRGGYSSVSRPVTAQPRVARRQNKVLRRLRMSWGYYLALLPTFLLLALFAYYPAVSGFYHSFFDWQPAFYQNFIGLENFQRIFHDEVFLRSFGNVAQFLVFGVTLAWLFPILAAELVITLSSERLRFLFRTLLVVPLAFPGVVLIYLWGFMYDPNVGVFNSFFRTVGLGGLAHNWLGDPHIALYSIMFIGAPWIASVPFLIFLAGLQAIPSELFDAAALDGASRLRRFFAVDLPLLGGQFRLMFVLAIIQLLQFAIPVALLTNGGPAYSTMMPVLYLLNTAFTGSDWGYAAALSVALFLLMLGLSTIALRISQSGRARARVPAPA